VQVASATAKALAGQGEASDAVGRNLAYLKTNASAIFATAYACAALGDPASVFAILDGYYFSEGRWGKVAPLAGDEDRQTGPLFQPPMRSLWPDPRFARLLSRTGLEDYWRRSRSVPDLRR
jgi:hypothetical protein